MGPASYHKEIMALVAFITTSLKVFACIWALMTLAVGASFAPTKNDSCQFLFFYFVLVFSTDRLMIIWLSVGNHFVTHTVTLPVAVVSLQQLDDANRGTVSTGVPDTHAANAIAKGPVDEQVAPLSVLITSERNCCTCSPRDSSSRISPKELEGGGPHSKLLM